MGSVLLRVLLFRVNEEGDETPVNRDRLKVRGAVWNVAEHLECFLVIYCNTDSSHSGHIHKHIVMCFNGARHDTKPSLIPL